MAADAALPKFPFLGCSNGRLPPPEAREPEEQPDPLDETFGPEKGHTGYGTTGFGLSRHHADEIRAGYRTTAEAQFARTGKRRVGKKVIDAPFTVAASLAG